MCRGIDLPLMLFMAAAVAFAAHVARADDVSAYLERHGLQELHAAHLESELESAQGERRDELVRHLAAVYAALLDSLHDDERRGMIEQRSRRLLEMTERGGAEELRLALLRAAYRQAERIAEEHRMRRSSEAEVERARAILADVVPNIIAFETQLERTVTQADRRAGRGPSIGEGAGETGPADRVEQLRELHAASLFLAAWGLYYQSWLGGGDTAAAAQAERYFARLVRVDGPNSDPALVSEDLRSLEPYARAILGMALCRSITRTHYEALEWLALLDHEVTAQAIRAQTPIWRVIVSLEHRQYRLALSELQAMLEDEDGEEGRTVPSAWLRLAAAYALEGGRGARGDDPQPLVQTAIAELASRGDLQQVLELAERYGLDALGDPASENENGPAGAGFALHFVRGLLTYREAREKHDASDEAAPGRDVRELYEQAIDHLSRSLESAAAGSHSVAVAASRRMLAWALFFTGEYDAAWREFERASAGLSRDEAAEALWMAIVAFDRLIESGADADRSAQLELMDRFLADYPRSPHAGKLMLRRAVEAEEITTALAEELLSIPPHDDAYLPARHRVTAFLYREFRNAAPRQRPLHAQRFLSVAGPLLGLDDPLAARRLVNVRRVLEVALADRVERLDAARRAFAELDRLEGETDLDAVRDEIAYRRVQERLLSNDLASAVQGADELWSSGESASAGDGGSSARHRGSSIWSRLASRAVFQHAHRQWKAMPASGGAEVDAALDVVARFGGRVLREFEGDPKALDPSSRSGGLALHAAVAEASAALYERRGDVDRGKAALFLYRRLIDAQPRSIEFLRGAALLAEPLGETDFAIECWRRLSAGGQTSGGDLWFEARYRLMALLAESNPKRAKQVMAQHRQLHPEYGPEPWGALLRALEARLVGEGSS